MSVRLQSWLLVFLLPTNQLFTAFGENQCNGLNFLAIETNREIGNILFCTSSVLNSTEISRSSAPRMQRTPSDQRPGEEFGKERFESDNEFVSHMMMMMGMNRRMKMKTRMKKKMKMGKKTREGKRLGIDNEFVLCHTPPLLSTPTLCCS